MKVDGVEAPAAGSRRPAARRRPRRPSARRSRASASQAARPRAGRATSRSRGRARRGARRSPGSTRPSTGATKAVSKAPTRSSTAAVLELLRAGHGEVTRRTSGPRCRSSWAPTGTTPCAATCPNQFRSAYEGRRPQRDRRGRHRRHRRRVRVAVDRQGRQPVRDDGTATRPSGRDQYTENDRAAVHAQEGVPTPAAGTARRRSTSRPCTAWPPARSPLLRRQ